MLRPSNLQGPLWERARWAVGSRKMEKSISDYSTCLPEGVTLKKIYATRTYQLRKGGILLASRCVEIVTQWERPERVFAYIARRTLRQKSKGVK